MSELCNSKTSLSNFRNLFIRFKNTFFGLPIFSFAFFLLSLDKD